MTTDFATTVSARKSQLQQIEKELAEQGVKFVTVHLPEINGILRSKIVPLKLGDSGEALNGLLYCISHSDGAPIGDCCFPAPISSEDNGCRNITAVADPGTVRRHDWAPRFASVLLNSFLLDGQPCPLDTRAILKAQERRAQALGFQPRFALEYEFGVFQADNDLLRQGRYRELKPWGPSYANYDLVRSGDYQSFVAAFIDRLESLGIGVASFVTEYGHGMYEFALKPSPPLQAADNAVRAKLHLRELCAERGLIATFMTRFRPPGGESASGCHHHQSLFRQGTNVFAAGANTLSPVAGQYLAGLLARLPDSHLLFRPTINSYRRFDRGAWSPEDVSWGFENRLAAIRAISTPNAEAARFEHRVAGADINPYLTIAAQLAAGLDGIEEQLTPEPPAPGNPAPLERPALPRTLAASLETFRHSAFIGRVFGEEFRDHYVLSRENELKAYDTWWAGHITDFEFQRYFTGT